MLDRKHLFEIVRNSIDRVEEDQGESESSMITRDDYKNLIRTLVKAEYGNGDADWLADLFENASTEPEEIKEFVDHLRVISVGS